MPEQDDAYRSSKCAADTISTANLISDPDLRERMLLAAAECAATAHAIIMKRATQAE
jgi:hypothetical protein